MSSPSGSDRRRAASVPIAPKTPESHSPIWPPTNTGARSGRPRAKPDDPSRPRLQGELGGGLVAPGTLEAERSDRRDDQMRVCAEDLAGCERGVLCHRRAAGPHDGVRRAEQGVQPCEIVRVLGIDHDALLRRVEEIEERAVAIGRDHRAGGRPSAQRIAVRWLDLDHLCAAVGEQLRAVRTPDPGREIDHSEPAERWCGGRLVRRARCRAASPSVGFGAPTTGSAQPPLGGNPSSLSFTARFRPASIVSLLSVARLPSSSSRSIPPIDSSHALSRLPMYSP